MTRAVIVDAVRSPSGRGKPGGQLSHLHSADLLGRMLAELVHRNDLDPALVDDVLGGCVTQAGSQSVNVTRSALLAAGFPVQVPGTTIDRQCGSSQQAVAFAAQGVIAGVYDVAIACGVEMMSAQPIGSATLGLDPYGRGVAARFPQGLVGQGISAELVAARWNIGRRELDEYAARSHRLAATAARSLSRFGSALASMPQELVAAGSRPEPRAGSRAGSIEPAHGLDRTAPRSASGPRPDLGAPDRARRDPLVPLGGIRTDETLRPGTTVEGLAELAPAFRSEEMSARFPEIDWRVTAGNSSPLTDAASAVLIMSERRALSLGLVPRARFHAFSVTGSDPIEMLTGILPATRMVLERGRLALQDLDAIEVNEAFASVPLAWLREFDVDPDLLNPRGGAIALGHALGSSGTRLLGTLLTTLEQTGGRYGLQTMCEGGGMANALVIERL